MDKDLVQSDLGRASSPKLFPLHRSQCHQNRNNNYYHVKIVEQRVNLQKLEDNEEHDKVEK